MSVLSLHDRLIRFFSSPEGNRPEGVPFKAIQDAMGGLPQGSVAGRLSDLVQEGVLEKVGHGLYRLRCSDTTLPAGLHNAAAALRERIPETELRSTILWDAGNYLELTEDGGPGPRWVIETPHPTRGAWQEMLFSELRLLGDALLVDCANRAELLEILTSNKPLDRRTGAPLERPTYLIVPNEGKQAATDLVPAGVRLARPERVITDFLGYDGTIARDIVISLLTGRSLHLDFGLLDAAAKERGLQAPLYGLMGAILGRLNAGLRDAFLGRVPMAGAA